MNLRMPISQKPLLIMSMSAEWEMVENRQGMVINIEEEGWHL